MQAPKKRGEPLSVLSGILNLDMLNLRDSVAAAVRALRENWLRSSLTTLGIVIGVGSVVLLVAIGQGVEKDITAQIESLGADSVFVVPGKLGRHGQPNPMSLIGISTLTQRDVHDLARIPGIAACVPFMFVYGAVERGPRTYSGFVVGCTSDVVRIRRRPLLEGRFFGPSEERAHVCVLSSDPKDEMFGSRPAVGQRIEVRGVPFRVIGVIAPEPQSLFAMFSFDNMIFIPIGTAKEAFRAGQINRILLKTNYRMRPEPILEAARRALLRNHGGREDFGILTQKLLLGAIYTVFNIVTAMLSAIAAISLLVAGIGIMNIMLVTVTERTREIGIRKTVGARRRDVFWQFLTEAVILSISGGIVGAFLAVVTCRIVAAHTPLRPLVTPGAIALAFGVCLGVGLLFGVAPALRAARMNPIDALRWE